MVFIFSNWIFEFKFLVSNFLIVIFKIMVLVKKEFGSFINYFLCIDKGKWKNF